MYNFMQQGIYRMPQNKEKKLVHYYEKSSY